MPWPPCNLTLTRPPSGLVCSPPSSVSLMRQPTNSPLHDRWRRRSGDSLWHRCLLLLLFIQDERVNERTRVTSPQRAKSEPPLKSSLPTRRLADLARHTERETESALAIHNGHPVRLASICLGRLGSPIPRRAAARKTIFEVEIIHLWKMSLQLITLRILRF